MYAQTNVQLYNQLARHQCTSDELALVRRAYDLAVQLFAGLYRPSGKTFLDHVVGTASIAQAIGRKPVLTAAGLLHSAYSHGDFGFAGRMSAGVRCKRIVDAVGSEVETYVRIYTELPWSMRGARELAGRIEDMAEIEREVVLLRVINELEDHLDNGSLYCYSAAKHNEKLEQKRKLLSDLAHVVGSDALAAEIDRVFADCAAHDVEPELLPRVRRPRSYRILPGSYRRPAWLCVYNVMSRVFRSR